MEKATNGRRKIKQRRAAVTVTLGVDVIAGLNELAQRARVPFSELVDTILRRHIAHAMKKEGTYDA